MIHKVLFGTALLFSTIITQAHADNCRVNPLRSMTTEAMSAIAANICALDAIRENERLPLTTKTTNTYFHEYNVYRGSYNITAKGVCSKAVDYYGQTISEGVPFEITIEDEDWRNLRNPVFKGTMGKSSLIGAQTLALKFNDSSDYSERCRWNTISHRTLSQIILGDGPLDIFRRERSNISATGLEQTWDGIPSTKAIRLDFQTRQFTGRHLRLVTSYDSYLNLLVKTGNYLFKEEGAREFDYDYPYANNIFMQEHGKMIGCSKFEQDGELDIPYMMNNVSCSIMQIRANKFQKNFKGR